MSDFQDIFDDEDIELVDSEENDDSQETLLFDIIPVSQEDEIVEYITSELDEIEAERATKYDDWQAWRRDREAIPEERVRNYPWNNSANVKVPLAAITGNTMYVQTRSALSRKPFWNVRALRTNDKNDQEIADFATKYMNILAESPRDLNLVIHNQVIQYEADTMGTCFVKVPWTTDTQIIPRIDPETKAKEEMTLVFHDGPDVDPIPLEDMYYRASYRYLEQCPLVAHCVHLSKPQFMNRIQQGVYREIEEAIKAPRTEAYRFEEAQFDREGVSPLNIELYDVYEVYLWWDVDNDGTYEPLVIWFHKESKSILRAEYNEIGLLPFVPIVLHPRPWSIEGIGTGHWSRGSQVEADTLHNMRLNNIHIAVHKMLGISSTARLHNDEEIYPGKLWYLDDPQRDIREISISDVYPSSEAAENLASYYAQKVTGISDPMVGFGDQTLKSGDTFSGQQLRLSQGQGLIGSILENMQERYGQIGMLIYFRLVANRDRVLENERELQRLDETEIQLLTEWLNIPFDQMPRRMSFIVHTTDIDRTFEARRQSMQMLFQMYGMYFQQISPIVQQVYQIQAQAMQMQAEGQPIQGLEDLLAFYSQQIVGYTKLMGDMFKLLGEEEPDDYLLKDSKYRMMVDQYERLQELTEQMQGGLNNALPRPENQAFAETGSEPEPEPEAGFPPTAGL